MLIQKPSISFLSGLLLLVNFQVRFLSYHDVVPVDGDVGVSVRSVHLVHEAEGVKELVNNHLDNDNDDNNNNDNNNNLLVDTATPLKPYLHPPSACPVGHLGVTATSSRDDVHIVMLKCASNKS